MSAWFEEAWDVIVVGTGMGGATLGRSLAAQGHKLLFLERGKDLLARFEEAPQSDDGAFDETPESRLAAGQWPTRMRGRTNRGDIDAFPSLGCGTGGSTLIYAAQLERLFAADFEPRAHFAETTDSTVPERWPVGYQEMLPFYREAERLFAVCGSIDPCSLPDELAPLRPPPSLSARDDSFIVSFRKLGLQPYQAHVGCDFVPGCIGCGGKVCRAHCKADARKAALVPALRDHGARLVTECEVLDLDADAERVRTVRVRWQGREHRVHGKLIVMAAGALMTPRILLDSRNAFWPEGLANRSGAVGRNLMFHVSDFVAIRPHTPASAEGPQRAVSLNDFYEHAGDKLGTLQSVGIPLNAGIVAAQLMSRLPEMPGPLRRLAHLACRLIGLALAFALRGSTLFATITEDLPYWHNRVVADPRAPSGVRFEYRYAAELDRRARRFREQLTRALRGRHRMLWLRFRHNLNFGHACGTCRFGDDPATSVLDRSNRAHGIDNLYVVDASFFPSSGGTNPGLTIAANALRVARDIGQRLGTPIADRADRGARPTAPAARV